MRSSHSDDSGDVLDLLAAKSFSTRSLLRLHAAMWPSGRTSTADHANSGPCATAMQGKSTSEVIETSEDDDAGVPVPCELSEAEVFANRMQWRCVISVRWQSATENPQVKV